MEYKYGMSLFSPVFTVMDTSEAVTAEAEVVTDRVFLCPNV
jgi:hypothetical protein